MPRRSGSPGLARELGARIKNARSQAGLTQEKLAWDCELTKGYMSQIESGECLPSLPVLLQIAEVIGVDVADLVTGLRRDM